MRGDGGLGQGGSGGGGESWSDSASNLKVEKTGFAAELDVGYELKRGV